MFVYQLLHEVSYEMCYLCTHVDFQNWNLSCVGHGAVLNVDGEVELDSIIMDGETLATGAVASVRNIANPVSLARAVMEKVYFSSQIVSELFFGGIELSPVNMYPI